MNPCKYSLHIRVKSCLCLFTVNKFIINVPSPFLSLLTLVQHGPGLSIRGVSSPVIGLSYPGRPEQAPARLQRARKVGGKAVVGSVNLPLLVD